MSVAIRVENLSKYYRLGAINHGMLYKDIQSWLARKRGKPDPHGQIGSDHFADRPEGFWALKDLNFDIQQGDRVGIIGKNGAGKSTLLKILSRITAPTEGIIKIKGRVTSLLEVGTGFHGELTGRENIYLNGAILGMKRREIDRKIDEIIGFSEIEQHIDTPVKRYSSGMYVRLAFAVAAHLDSEILIADEVLAVGDAAFQKKALGKMQDLSTGEGRTVLFVSHNMGAVKSLCEKGILLTKGRIAANGSMDAVISSYFQEDGVNLQLGSRIHRRGDGRFKFVSIEFLNGEGESVSEILCAESLTIRLAYEKVPEIVLSRVIISLSFRDEYQHDVISFISDEMATDFHKDQIGIITLTIPKLLLRGGQYNIRLFSSYGSTSQENILDEIESAALIVVNSTDYWRCGRTVRPGKLALHDGTYASL